MVSSDLIQFYLILLGCSSLVYFAEEYLTRKAQRKYENDFTNENREAITELRTRQNAFLPLLFPHRERENLLKLCREYRSKWTVEHYLNRFILRVYEPSVQIRRIVFRRIVPRPSSVPVGVLRCNARYALIASRDGISGYVLEKGKSDADGNQIEFFHIQSKFFYKQDEPRAEAGTEELRPLRREHQRPNEISQSSSDQAQLATTRQRVIHEYAED